MRALLLWLLLALAAGVPALADEFRPAYLQLEAVSADQYDVLWKVPALDADTPLKLRPVFPPSVRAVTPVSARFANGMVVQRWRIAAPGLEGRAITFPALPGTPIDLLVRLVRQDGSVQLQRVGASDPRFVASGSPDAYDVVRTYTLLGIEHILGGIDHLLFVLALVMLVPGLKRLLWTVTAFTLAHSITLALATLGVLQVPGPPVEAIIALSIVFVASEIVATQRGRPGLAAKQPWLVAFSFGLLHGLGFAGALAEIGLPANAIPLALLCFNVGVETGQLLFIAGVLLAARLVRRLVAAQVDLAPALLVPAYAIGGIASFWVIDRVAAFWG